MPGYVLIVDRWEGYAQGQAIEEADVDRYLGRYPYVIGRADGEAVTEEESLAARLRLDPGEGAGEGEAEAPAVRHRRKADG